MILVRRISESALVGRKGFLGLTCNSKMLLEKRRSKEVTVGRGGCRNGGGGARDMLLEKTDVV
jgi:hypothetical protein